MNKSKSPLLVVGVGASAGGLDALKGFFNSVPEDTQLAFIVVQHLDPTHKSMMADILSKQTPISFCEASDKQKIEAGRGYVIPPNAYIEVVGNKLHIVKPTQPRGSRLAIDHLFRSMAKVYKTKAVGIVLSGSGGDGTAGLRALKAAGGLSVVQTPKTAEYPSMPRSAIEAGIVDQILDVDSIYPLLLDYAEHPYHQLVEADTDHNVQEQLRKIAALLKASENFDLSQYKQTTVQRRLYRRMSLTGETNNNDYIQLLRESKDERQLLMRDLLINVTDFFRDKDAFELLQSQVINNIVDETENGSDIRVWIAGCASGEEAYSVAILFMEKIAASEKDLGLKIFATDIDDEAIKIARKGVYADSVITELPVEYLDKYFEQGDAGYYAVRSGLRDCISFANQNVYTDPPFSKLHLVCCRNLLIYLNNDVQHKVLQSFYFSLLTDGYLFLGSSENIGELKPLFTAVSQKWRIFSRRERESGNNRNTALPSFFNKNTRPTVTRRQEPALNQHQKSKFSLLSALEPSVLIDENNRVIYFHGNVNQFLQLPVGEAELNFFGMLDPQLRTRIRSGIFKARKNAEAVVVNPPTRYHPDDDSKKLFTTRITPLVNDEHLQAAFVLTFTPLLSNENRPAQSHLHIDATDQETMIDAMERELLETKEELQNTTEELETSTEELRAAHEEALSTNEELQSSNEELEASTEELRSLNEELTTVNAQLKEKVDELSSTHDDIKNFFASTNLATVFLSNELKIKRFTPAAERLLNINISDVERNLHEVSRQFIDDRTFAEAKRVLDSLESSEKEILVDDKWFLQRILPYQTEDRRVDGVVLTFSDITHLKNAVTQLQASSKQHAVIAELGIKALSTNNMDNLMDQLVREVAHTLDADFSKVLEYIPAENHLFLKAGIGWDKGLVGEATVPTDIASQGGFTLNTRGPVIVEDLEAEQRFSGPALLSEHKVVSGVSCVIENGDTPYGVLAVHTLAKRKFSQDDANFLVSAANILSVALHRTSIEKQLRENEKRLRIAKDSNTMGSFEYMIQSGDISWDKLLDDIWGVNNNEVTYELFTQGVHPQDLPQVQSAIEQAVQGKDEGHYQANYRVINQKTQRVTWVEATGQVLFEKNVAIKIIGMVIDITEKMKLESSLKAAVHQLQEANEKKNEFLATLGHEIRNPLAAINSGVQIIERDESQLKRALSMIENNVAIVSSLLDDLLDLTRISRGQISLNKQPIDINRLLSEIYQGFSRQCEEKQQQTSIDLPATPIICNLDKIRIQQVIGNVINNAHKFTPAGGEISIALRKLDEQIEISVKDTGVGLDMQFKDKVFEPFHQLGSDVSRGNSGLGIGLSLVRQFVLLHDGSVTVHSDGAETGTEFVISLPIGIQTQLPVGDPDPKPRPTTRNNLEQVSVLIVDDNEDAAYGLSLILEMKGCQVHPCYNGASALAAIDTFTPNVLILDIGLPDISGYELLKKLSVKLSNKTLNIALTGYGHKEARDKSRQAGFDFHMNKPVNFEELLVLLSERAGNKPH